MNENKNSALGIVALVLSILGCTFVIGAILAIIDLCKNDGRKKVLPIISLVICGIWLLVGILGGKGLSEKNNQKSTTDNNVITTENIIVDTTEESQNSIPDAVTDSEITTEAEKTESYFKDNIIVVDDSNTPLIASPTLLITPPIASPIPPFSTC